MKKLFLLLVLSLGFATVQAQENPFAEYGYTPKVATLSQGQFNEFHDQDTIVQIGSVLFNTKSKQIVAFVEYDTLYSEATLEPDIVSRWMSPDPLNQFILSPYLSFANNPILLTDPDGGWVPGVDDNGKIILTAEKGDNVSTLYAFFGGKENAKEYLPTVWTNSKTASTIKLQEGDKVYFNSNNNFSQTMSYYQRNKEKFDSKPTYDCKDLCASLVLKDEAKTNTDGTGNSSSDVYSFGRTWKNKVEIDESEQEFGESFSYWSWTPPIGDHAAIFFGRDQEGNEYFFTKNGKSGKLEIMSQDQLDEVYNLYNLFKTTYKSDKTTDEQ